MVKRVATSVLNADNWDQDDQVDDSELHGGPKLADEETLKKRTIIKAKRKQKTGASGGFSAGSLFSAAFSSVKEKSEEEPEKTNMFRKDSSTTGLTNQFMFKPTAEPTTSSQKSSQNPEPQKPSNGTDTPTPNLDDQIKDEKFQKAVSKLNQKFVKSVQDFVKSNECVDLQPCFDSYNKHFEKIVTSYATDSVLEKLQANGLRNFNVSKKSVEEISSKKEKIEEFKASQETESTPKINPFKFNAGQNEQPKKPTFNFGNQQSLSSTSKPFTFSGTSGGATSSLETQTSQATKPFQFSFAGNNQASSSSTIPTPIPQKSEPEKPSEEGQPSDAVPEIEDKQFNEEGVVFEIRCKLFYKHNGQYKERGVGTLFIKKDEENGKGSILVRAENHQGTILLNSGLSKGMPSPMIQGTKNVLLSCIVNPEIPKQEELTGEMNLFLVKVKTEESANELMDSIKQFV